MRPVLCIVVLFCLQFSTLHAAELEAPPEQEMLQLMDLLQKWEVLQHLELMRQMETAGQMEKTSAGEEAQTPQPQIRIEDGQTWIGNLR